jgi:hypothetical protein
VNRIVKSIAAVAITLGLAVVGLPLQSGGMTVQSGVGSTGCCKV